MFSSVIMLQGHCIVQGGVYEMQSRDGVYPAENDRMDTILVTGGAGFIGGCFIRQCIAEQTCRIVNFDKLTYAGNLDSLRSVENNPRYSFVCGDIADQAAVDRALAEYAPTAIVHFAAESHVDLSLIHISE